MLIQNSAGYGGKSDIKDISWYIFLYTPAVIKQVLINLQITTKSTSELSYFERYVSSEDVKQQIEWKFNLVVREGLDLTTDVIVGFRQRDRLKYQLLSFDSFYTPPLKLAQSIIRTEKYRGAGIFIGHAEADYSRGYSQFVSFVEDLTKDDIIQPFISQNFIAINVIAAG